MTRAADAGAALAEVGCLLSGSRSGPVRPVEGWGLSRRRPPAASGSAGSRDQGLMRAALVAARDSLRRDRSGLNGALPFGASLPT